MDAKLQEVGRSGRQLVDLLLTLFDPKDGYTVSNESPAAALLRERASALLDALGKARLV